VEISIRNNDQGDIIAKVERAKDGPSGVEIYSRLEPVDTGRVDRNGKPITSVIVVPLDAANIPAKPQKKTRSKALDLVMKIITDFATEKARPFADGPEVPCANTEAVRIEFHKRWVGEPDAKRQAWGRAINSHRNIGQRDGKCWIIISATNRP